MRISKLYVSIKVNSDEYLLINTRNGSVDIVDKDIIDLLFGWEKLGFKYDENIRDLCDALRDSGYLTEESPEEELLEVKMFCDNLFARFSRCKTHIIIPTYNCNLRCIYCWESFLKKRGREWIEKTLDEDAIDEIFNAISYLDKNCPLEQRKPIILFGGEPLLPENIEIVGQILDKGAKLGYPFFVVTNGVTLEQYLPILRKFRIQGVQITLDGPKDIHDSRRFKEGKEGTFEDIISSIERAKEIELPVYIRVMVDESNEERIYELAEFIIAKGWHRDKNIRLYLASVFPHGRVQYCHADRRDIAMARLVSLMRSHIITHVFEQEFRYFHPIDEVFLGQGDWFPLYYYCDAHYSQLFYDPHGDIYPCWLTLGEKEHSIGTYSPKLTMNKNYELWRSRNVFNLERCKQCRNALLCGGGCAYSVYEQKGTIMDSDCKFFEALYKYYIPYLYHKVTRRERK